MSELYTYTIFPIELIYKYIYLVLVLITDNYGWALFALSFLNYFLLMPLNKLVRGVQKSEDYIQQVLSPQLKLIKDTSRDAERHQRVQNLYQRYSYHPIFAIRNVFPLLVQLPFLMAVYFMLSSLVDIEGVRFFFLQNLAQPDAVMFGYNIMPIIMTLVSLLNACFVVPLSTPQRRQAIIVSLLFFVLLYNAPSALLLYWTMNNVMILVFGAVSKVSSVKKTQLSLAAIRARFLPSVLDSSGLLLGLCFIVPLYFTLGLNVNFFNELQIVNFFAFLLIAFFALLLCGVVLDKLISVASKYRYRLCLSFPCRISIKKISANERKWYQIEIRDFFYLMIAIFFTLCVTWQCINIKLFVSDFVVINTIRLCLVVFLFLVIKRYHFSIVNIALLSIFLFSTVQFAKTKKANDDATATVKTLIEDAYNNFPMDVKLRNKPNIYVVFMESYMNTVTLRDTYGIDMSNFENSLRKKGFQVYDDIYSHSSFTKASLLNLLLMKEDVSSFYFGFSDVITKAHEIFGGGEGNLLFEYLQSNGYSISTYYDSQSYYFKQRDSLLDHTIKPIDRIDISYLSVLSEIAPSLHFRLEQLRRYLYGLPLSEKIVDIYPPSFAHIEELSRSASPSFFLLKPLNNLHLADYGDSTHRGFKTWIQSGIYRDGIEQMNEQLLSLIHKVEEHDPNAVIILIGDHGHKYTVSAGGFPTIKSTPAEVEKDCPHVGVTSEEFIDDFFSVYLAIKMPKDMRLNLGKDGKIVYADLFRYIFATLANDPAFLKHESSDISINNAGVILRKDDQIFENGKKAK